jgi:hypothetical protein
MDFKYLIALGAIVSALITSLFSPSVLYFYKKKHQAKSDAFNLSVRALSRYYAEALDPEYQNKRVTYRDMLQLVYISSDTSGLIAKARAHVKTYFSDKAFKEYDKAIRTHLSIENSPNIDFEAQQAKAQAILAKELDKEIVPLIIRVILLIACIFLVFLLGYAFGTMSTPTTKL